MQLTKKFSLFLLLCAFLATAAPMTVLGQEIPDPVIEDYRDVTGLLNKFLAWIFTILLIVAAIFIVLAAFNYLTAQGDEGKIKTAKDQIIYAAVAIGVGLLATSVAFLVRNFLGSTTNVDVRDAGVFGPPRR